MELNYISETNRSLGRRDSADCWQRGTKGSAAGAERVQSQPAVYGNKIGKNVTKKIYFKFDFT